MSNKAFMSTNGGQLREASTFCDMWPVVEVDRAVRHAEREARAILAETERPVTMFGGHNVAFHVSLTLLNRDLIDDGALDPTALAESLAAFIEGDI